MHACMTPGRNACTAGGGNACARGREGVGTHRRCRPGSRPAACAASCPDRGEECIHKGKEKVHPRCRPGSRPAASAAWCPGGPSAAAAPSGSPDSPPRTTACTTDKASPLQAFVLRRHAPLGPRPPQTRHPLPQTSPAALWVPTPHWATRPTQTRGPSLRRPQLHCGLNTLWASRHPS